MDILLVRSKEPAAFYSYNGRTAGKCIQEIREFSRDSFPPDKERHQQTFIVSRLLYNAGNNDHSHLAEVFFFGFGKNCFALDYADFALKHLGSIRPQERLLTKSYGELCLQAGEWTQPPHNDLPASLNKRLGTALMNNGNYTFGTSPTALTPATCSTLDRSETFASKRNKTKFYTHAGSPPRVSRSSLTCSGETLELSFRMTGEFDHVNECIQEPPYRVNEDYDIAFTARISPEKADVSRSVSLSHPEQRD